MRNNWPDRLARALGRAQAPNTTKWLIHYSIASFILTALSRFPMPTRLTALFQNALSIENHSRVTGAHYQKNCTETRPFYRYLPRKSQQKGCFDYRQLGRISEKRIVIINIAAYYWT